MKTGFVYGHEYQAANILADMLSAPPRDWDYEQTDQIGGFVTADEAVDLVLSIMQPPANPWIGEDGRLID
jgi:hypothetical protein